MAGRYEISYQGWALIEDIVSPETPAGRGRPRRDDRQMLNGIFWILCSGAKWRDLPERSGPWKTVYQRFRQWRDDGTLERILSRLQKHLLSQLFHFLTQRSQLVEHGLCQQRVTLGRTACHLRVIARHGPKR